MPLLRRHSRLRSAVLCRKFGSEHRLRLVCERLESRCLLSSGFEPGIAVPLNLRVVSAEHDPSRDTAIRRVQPEFVVEHRRLRNDEGYFLLPVRETQTRTIESRIDLRPEWRNSKIRESETGTRRLASVLDVRRESARDGDQGVRFLSSDNANTRPMGAFARDRWPIAIDWRPYVASADGPSWERTRFDAQIGGKSSDCSSLESTESVDALDAAHAATASSTASDTRSLAVLDAALIESMCVPFNADASAAAASFGCVGHAYESMIVARTAAAEWDLAAHATALDCVFNFEMQNAAASLPRDHGSGALAAESASSEKPMDSATHGMAVAAAAMLVATRAESRTKESRRAAARGIGWIGALAQFLVTPRFKTPRRPTILLAMCDEALREQCARGLRDDGYDVLDFGTLGEAVKHVRAEWISLDGVIMDSELDYSGVHLFARIRERYPRIPVVVCGDRMDNAGLVHFRRLGARRCLLKPVQVSELLAAVNALVW